MIFVKRPVRECLVTLHVYNESVALCDYINFQFLRRNFISIWFNERLSAKLYRFTRFRRVKNAVIPMYLVVVWKKENFLIVLEILKIFTYYIVRMMYCSYDYFVYCNMYRTLSHSTTHCAIEWPKSYRERILLNFRLAYWNEKSTKRRNNIVLSVFDNIIIITKRWNYLRYELARNGIVIKHGLHVTFVVFLIPRYAHVSCV